MKTHLTTFLAHGEVDWQGAIFSQLSGRDEATKSFIATVMESVKIGGNKSRDAFLGENWTSSNAEKNHLITSLRKATSMVFDPAGSIKYGMRPQVKLLPFLMQSALGPMRESAIAAYKEVLSSPDTSLRLAKWGHQMEQGDWAKKIIVKV